MHAKSNFIFHFIHATDSAYVFRFSFNRLSANLKQFLVSIISNLLSRRHRLNYHKRKKNNNKTKLLWQEKGREDDKKLQTEQIRLDLHSRLSFSMFFYVCVFIRLFASFLEQNKMKNCFNFSSTNMIRLIHCRLSWSWRFFLFPASLSVFE